MDAPPTDCLPVAVPEDSVALEHDEGYLPWMPSAVLLVLPVPTLDALKPSLRSSSSASQLFLDYLSLVTFPAERLSA